MESPMERSLDELIVIELVEILGQRRQCSSPASAKTGVARGRFWL